MLKRWKCFTHIPVLVEHADEPVREVEEVSPVKIRQFGRTVLWWAVVEEVEDVFGGERCLLQTPVNEIHHRWIANGVLNTKGRKFYFYLFSIKRIKTFSRGSEMEDAFATQI